MPLLATLVALAAAELSPVIADPRRGPSPWAVVEGALTAQPCGAAGYLIPLPADVTQEWLEGVVALSACGAPLLTLGGQPSPEVRPYVDGVVLATLDADASLEEERSSLGLPLVVEVADGAAAVRALAAGAEAVLASLPPPRWEKELVELLPAPTSGVFQGQTVATALRAGDLAIVLGLPAGFPGGEVQLADDWVGESVVVGEETVALPLTRRAGRAALEVPELPAGGVVVVRRPAGGGAQFEALTVTGTRLPEVGEVLARHQRAAARQARLVSRWIATQRLLVRVRVGELGRSLELELEGPVYVEEGVGRDWEITQAWLGGVAWPPERLPDVPLLEAQRPPVPPLAVRLQGDWGYALAGVVQRQGRECYLLTFTANTPGREARSGEACVDRATYGLVELTEGATGLPGEVHSTTQVTVNAPLTVNEVVVWLPERVVADDLVSAFGAATSVRRELTVRAIRPNPPEFAAERATAYRGARRMIRDAPTGVVRLVRDGSGGRVPEQGKAPRVQLLLGGVAVDPGLDTPLPFGGFQLTDFDFRGRGEQLRLFAAGVVNDVAWVRRQGASELNVGAFAQLLPFASPAYRRGEEIPAEKVKVQRQRLGLGVARAVGRTRVSLDLQAHRWDFRRADTTADPFEVPPDTWEGVLRCSLHTMVASTSLSAFWEAGQRARWAAWGERRWQRYHAAVAHDRTLGFLARLTLGAEVWGGRDLDRFSAPAPGRFGPLRLRGVPSGRVTPDRLALARAALTLPIHPRLRGEVGFDAGWVRDERAGEGARPLAGVGIAATVPGPWSALVEFSVGYPLAVPGRKGFTAEVLLLRPLAASEARR